MFDLFLVLIIAFLMLMDGDFLWTRFTGMLSEELRSEFELLRMSTDRSFGGFIRGSLILGLLYGIATLPMQAPTGGGVAPGGSSFRKGRWSFCTCSGVSDCTTIERRRPLSRMRR